MLTAGPAALSSLPSHARSDGPFVFPISEFELCGIIATLATVPSGHMVVDQWLDRCQKIFHSLSGLARLSGNHRLSVMACNIVGEFTYKGRFSSHPHDQISAASSIFSRPPNLEHLRQSPSQNKSISTEWSNAEPTQDEPRRKLWMLLSFTSCW